MVATSRSGGDKSANGSDCFPQDGLPSKPTSLPKEESQVWNELLGQIPAELLRRADAYQLQILCECIVTNRSLLKAMRADPADLPNHRAYNQTAAHISRLSSQFGLSPIDRRRLKFDHASGDDADDWASQE